MMMFRVGFSKNWKLLHCLSLCTIKSLGADCHQLLVKWNSRKKVEVLLKTHTAPILEVKNTTGYTANDFTHEGSLLLMGNTTQPV